jgi:site-specific DNA-methyltransferase (adenine-specific)
MRVETIGDCVLYQGDCLEILPEISDADAVITDPPYGVTECAWDEALNLSLLWERLLPCRKDARTPVVVFCQQPFATDLINSARRLFRYRWIWVKNAPVGFLNAYKAPMRTTEEIAVFYAAQPVYNPRGVSEGMCKRRSARNVSEGTRRYRSGRNNVYGADCEGWEGWSGKNMPRDVLYFAREQSESTHPTRKPLELLEYLTLTYTDAGGLVLDPFMGVGTTGVACARMGRRFVGVELDARYFDAACKRIAATCAQGRLAI